MSGPGFSKCDDFTKTLGLFNLRCPFVPLDQPLFTDLYVVFPGDLSKSKKQRMESGNVLDLAQHFLDMSGFSPNFQPRCRH